MLRVKFYDGQIEVIRDAGSRVDIKVSDSYVEIGKPGPFENFSGGFSVEPVRIEFEGPLDVSIRYERQKLKEDETQKTVPNISQASHKPTSDKTNTDYVVEAIRLLGNTFRTTDELKPYLEQTGFKSKANKLGNVIRYYLSTDERIIKFDSGWGLKEWENEPYRKQADNANGPETEAVVSSKETTADEAVDDAPETEETHSEPSF